MSARGRTSGAAPECAAAPWRSQHRRIDREAARLLPAKWWATIVFDHIGFPNGKAEHLPEGWRLNYWEPLEKYFG